MPLDDGIWRYDEGESASPTFSELLNRLGDSVRAALAQSDTGWVSAVGGETNVIWRRIGKTVEVRWSHTGAAHVSGDYFELVGGAQVLPNGLAPAGSVNGGGLANETGVALRPITAELSPTGRILVIKPSVQPMNNFRGSFLYLLG